MRTQTLTLTLKPSALALAAAALLVCLAAPAPAWAGRDDAPGQAKKHGGGEHGQQSQHGQQPHQAHQGRDSGGPARELRIGAYFTLSDRDAARGFYEQRYAETRSCPPGLAKKNNGCLPPGQAKKYMVGQRLPRDLVVYPVPRGVLVHLPPVPVGHEYVRVAADILLIAVGTQMVVDAITDLAR